MQYHLLCASKILIIISLATSIIAQSKKDLDISAIKSMEGCYHVQFKYTETFAPEVDYEKAFDYTSEALEWAEVIESTNDKIVLQHLLIINDSTIIKHWRQDWVYQDVNQYRYDKDNLWKYEPRNTKSVAGQWSQHVYQVDDSPRYSGSATWVHVDGISSWKTKADSPLPRREHTKRSDYNVMKRGNTVYLTENGWMHEQDNEKVIRVDNAKDVLLVQEKGYNIYTKRPDADCKSAQKWWSKNQDSWAGVRVIWDDIYSKHHDINLHETVNNKKLYEQLTSNINGKSNDELVKVIHSYVK
jgi:hypothetical protein